MFDFKLLIVCIFSSHAIGAQIQMSDRIEINRKSAEVGVGDFDKDGHVDIAICNAEQRWYAGPDFTTWYKIGDADGGPYAARVADINNDGWDDFITSDGTRTDSQTPGELYVYINPGDTGDPKGLWPRILVYSGNVRHQNDLRIEDMDGDGRLDIIERTWSSERVVVALQNPNINIWTVRTFDTGENGTPEGISAGDIDGDDEMEIVLSGVYWDNPGGWRSGDPIEYIIDENFVQEEVKSAVGDIDGDDDMDVYMGSAEGGAVYLAWYENDGLDTTGGIKFIRHIIKNNFGKCHMVELIDFNNDKQLDLCTARSFNETGCYIFLNNNNGSSWTEINYDSNGAIYTGVVRDLDKDGDLDIVGPSGFYKNVFYYINEGPIEPPTAPSNITVDLIDCIDIQLNWQDNASNEASFEIQRLESGSWSTIATVPADIETYRDSETAPITSYTYRVRASNAGGNSDWIQSSSVLTKAQSGAVMIAPPAGFYEDTVAIVLTAEQPFDVIRYTVNGSTPDTNSTIYTTPFPIGTNTTVKARSFSTGLAPSAVQTNTYLIGDQSIDQGLVAHWTFDENQGDMAADRINGNDASLNALSWANGQINSGLQFDGVESRAQAGDLSFSGDSMTICLWLRPSDLDNVEARFISKADGTAASDHNWMLSQISGSGLRFRLHTSNGGTATLASAANELEANEWTFIVGRYDGTAMTIWKNARLVSSLSKTGTISNLSGMNVAIGNQPIGAGDRPFAGIIDDVRIYNRALSETEINQLYSINCANYFLLNNMIEEDQTINSGNLVELRDATINENSSIFIQSPIVDFYPPNIIAGGSTLTILAENGCTN